MKKTLLSVALLLACTSIWAAGYTRNLNENITVPGYNFSAFYNFQTNTPEVLPTTGDLRYRDGNIWGLHNFGSGARSASVTISVSKDDLIILQDYNGTATIAGCTANASASTSTGYLCFDVAEDATSITISTARYGGVVAAVVMNKDNNVVEADYNVVYKCDGEIIGETSGKTPEGVVPTIVKDDIFVDGVKYIYVSDDSEAKTYNAGDPVGIEVEYRKANTYSYEVTSNLLQPIASGSGYEGETVNYYIPYYSIVDGKFYAYDNISKYGQGSIVLDEDNKKVVVNYTEEENSNVVFYAEAEDIPGITRYEDGYTQIRMSQGAVGYAAELGNTVIATLPAGKYTLTSSSRAGKTVFTANGEDILTLESTGAVTTATSAEFVFDKETSIGVSAGDTKNYFDYVLIRKTGDVAPAALNTLLSAGIYSAAGSVELVEGVTEDMIPASFKKYVGKYMSSCTLEGDENALTFSANSEDALLSAFTIKGDKIAYDETTVITLGGKEFGVQGLNGETKGTLNLVAQDGHFIYIDGFTVTYLGKPVAVVKDLGIGQGNGTEAAPYIVYTNESLPGPKASVMDPVTYQYSYTYYQYTAEKDGVLELSTAALGYVMGDINGESLGTKVVKAGDVLVIRMGAQYDLSSQAWTLNVRDLAEGETQATAIELAEGNNDVKSIQNGGLPMWYAVKVPAQKQVTVAFVDGYPGGYIVNGETETRIEYINGAYKAVYLNESDAEQTIYLRIESLYQECKAEVSYKDASEILPAITALGNPAFSIENGAELAEAPESITVTFPEIKGAVAEDDVFAAIYVFELDEDGNQTGSPINLAGYEYVGTVAGGITIDNVEFEAGKSYKINVSTVGVREVADLGYRKEYAYTYPNADENPTNIQNEITFSVASGDAPIVVEGVISLFDENVTIAAGESAYLTDKINVDEEEIDAVKIGTAKKAGSIILTVPAGAEGVSFYALSWAKESGTVLTATWGEDNTQEFTLTEGGVSGNSPYTYDAEKGGDHTAHCYTVEFAEPLAEATEVTLSAPKRVVFYNYVASATGLNNATVAGAVVNGKFVKNGKLLIVKNGIMYNAAGIQVK